MNKFECPPQVFFGFATALILFLKANLKMDVMFKINDL